MHVIDNDGWFHSGDIGEFTSEGLRILGRKDGTFKLTTGEKVHPQRIENVLVNESPYIQLALVVGSGKDYVGALIYADGHQLREWMDQEGSGRDSAKDDSAVRELLACELARVNPMIDVKFQRIQRAVLAEHEPSLANGELTATGKLVRKAVLNNYRHKIEDLFSCHPSEEVIVVRQPELQRV